MMKWVSVRATAVALVGVLFGVAQGCSRSDTPDGPKSPVVEPSSPSAAPVAITRALDLGRADAQLAEFLEASNRGIERSGRFLTTPGWRAPDARPRVAARLGATADAAFHVGITPDETHAIRLVRDGARQVEVGEHDGRVVYAEAYPATDVIGVATSERYEELLVLRNDTAPQSFSWSFELPASIPNVAQQFDGSLAFLDPSGEPAILVLKPFVLDAHGTKRDARIVLERSAFRIEIDSRGLEYPLLLDPAFDAGIWSVAANGAPPIARVQHAMAFQAVAVNAVVMFGGFDPTGGVYLADTWLWNGTAWAAGPVAGPPKRREHAMAYDVGRNEVVLFGGIDVGVLKNDTWVFNGTTWTVRTPPAPPTPRRGHAMAYENSGARVLMFGGNTGVYSNELWAWNGTPPGSWVQICTAAPCSTSKPTARAFHGMAHDQLNSRTYVFGGFDGATENQQTHAYNGPGNSWTNPSNTGPAARRGLVMAQDTIRRKTVMFGGFTSGVGLQQDVWDWDGATSTWTAPAPLNAPSARQNTAMAFDAVRKKMVVFSGDATGSPEPADTLTYYMRGNACSAGGTCDTGFCVDSVCCDVASCGTCQRCDSGGQAAESGVCKTVINADDPGTCDGANSCDALGACKKKNGQTCVGGTECVSGICTDGRCCVNDCTTPCLSCANASGTCTTVISSADDPPVCSGANTCSASGACGKKLGQSCALGTECASGFCADGTCCVSNCTTPCLSCANPAGTCTTQVTNQDDGSACTGANTCDGSGACKKKNGQSCTILSECASASCQDSTCCADNCTTPCRSCANATGTCSTLVTGQTDNNCATPNTCDATGTCKKALGQTCVGASECASNFCADGRCCVNGCTGSCLSCANASGACNAVTSADDADTCTGANTCSAAGQCKKKTGQGCAAATECASNFCKDSVCCGSACTAACQNCATGSCAGVTSADDADTCTGNNTCDPAGACKKKNGQSCAAVGECASGICKDNTCCGSACTGTCQSCANASGSCQTVTGASDPDTCASPNACDPAGQCKLLDGQPCGTGSACVSGFCANGVCCNTACTGGCDVCTAALGATQDGDCTLLASGVAGTGCGGYLCNGASASCPTTCTNNAQCASGNFCESNACVPKKALGETCTQAFECANNICADGVCCNTSCTGKCMACAAANKQSGINSGTCDAAQQGTNPGNQCVQSPDACGEKPSCAGTPGTCSQAPFGTSCGPTSCNGTAVSGKICDGTGTCIDQTNAQCSPYVCQNGACTSPCGVDTDCETTHYCTNGTCVPKSANGQGCALSKECTSGFCVDSVCCNAPCNGQCEACDDTANLGACVPIAGPPHGTKTPCAGSGLCQGACDKTDPTACTFPATGTACDPASCTGDVSQPAGACDGVGECAVPATKNCLPYACDATAGTCKATCVSNADCGQGATCDTGTGKCAIAGATCKDAFTVLLPNGQEQSCAPYKCVGGACQQQCSAAADCAPGYDCEAPNCVAIPDSGTGGTAGASGGAAGSGAQSGSGGTGGQDGGAGTGGKKASPKEAGDDGGCGCRLPVSGGPSHAQTLLILAFAALGFRRRRGRLDAGQRSA